VVRDARARRRGPRGPGKVLGSSPPWFILPRKSTWENIAAVPSSCRDQGQFLELGWSMLQYPCSHRVCRSRSGSRRASWLRFSTSLWIVSAWMGISCRIPCLSEYPCHDNLSTFSVQSSTCKLTKIKKHTSSQDHDSYSCW
jgi:hypothetical protein